VGQAAAKERRLGSDRGERTSRESIAVRYSGSTAATTLRDDSPGAYHLVWVSSLLLLIGGMCMILSVSMAEAVGGGDKYGLLRPQGLAAVVGLVLLVVLSRVNYRRLRVGSVVFLAIVGLFLCLVHVPQLSASEGGASSWFSLGPLSFQPSEFAKLALVLLGAHLLSSPRTRSATLSRYMWPFGVVGLAMCGLVTLEGDLGTALIIAGLMMGLLWVGGMDWRQWALVAGGGLAVATGLICSSGERVSRFFSFVNPSADPQGASYQLWQSLVALGRGGWFGVGPGQSVQKFQYLPKAHTDMIFSILGEEFGLVGTTVVFLLFAGFAVACWKLARRCADPMGRYLIAGCGMLVTFQAIVNIGGVIGALPLTGVPLPFMSYGRTSLVVMLMAVGLILAVAKRAPARTRPSPAAARYSDNVTRIDSRRWNSGARSARSGAR
jgi:cell division protein FtsW